MVSDCKDSLLGDVVELKHGIGNQIRPNLLAHAFDTLGCPVVGWRIDNLNLALQRAIERLGAKKDGVIRRQAVRRDGTIRDTVMYSMTVEEWPQVRERLLRRIESYS